MRSLAALPPALATRAHPACGRYGIEVDRHCAFGFDLYAQGRSAVLPRQTGGTITAQVHLELAWRCARSALAPFAAVADLDPMDRIVGGASPLGVESVTEKSRGNGGASMAPTPYGRLLAGRHRAGFDVEPVVATWSFSVFALRTDGAPRFVCIPRAALAQLLDLLDTGVLDDVLAAHARTPPTDRVLASFEQTQHAGIWDAVGEPTQLLPPERDPAPGSKRQRTAGVGHPPVRTGFAARPGKPSTTTTVPPATGRRPGKPAVPLAARVPITPVRPVALAAGPPPSPGRRRRRRPATIVLGVVLLAALVGAAVAVGVRSEKRDRVIESVATTSVTTVPATSAVPTTAGPTTTAEQTTTSPAPVTTAVPPPSVPVTAVPATTSTTPATTAATTVPPTTTTVPPPTIVAVNNCTFSPTTLSAARGSTIRFRNDSPTATITLTLGRSPGTGDVFFTVEPGGVTGPFVLNVAGTYVFLCRGAGTGQIAVTAT